ncbi:MAG: pilus assembly FimT family protein [Akkermansiaceae bacterium]
MNLRSHSPRSKHSSGFSLLEIVFVLGLVAVIVTWITVSVGTVETEEKLRRASGEIVSVVVQARNIAVRQQRPYEVSISKENVSLSPQYEIDQETSGRDEDEVTNSDLVVHEDVKSSSKQDGDVTYEILRWRADDWISLEKDKKVFLVIEPSGLVEPISIRCTIGQSWIIQELHPLTGGVRDEQTSIQKE